MKTNEVVKFKIKEGETCLCFEAVRIYYRDGDRTLSVGDVLHDTAGEHNGPIGKTDAEFLFRNKEQILEKLGACVLSCGSTLLTGWREDDEVWCLTLCPAGWFETAIPLDDKEWCGLDWVIRRIPCHTSRTRPSG